MSGTRKTVLLVLGGLSALFLVTQLVMGQLIYSGRREPSFVKAHRHTGYTAVALSMVYLALSMSAIAGSTPTRKTSVVDRD